MVVESVILYNGYIDFCLLIISYDGNITTSLYKYIYFVESVYILNIYKIFLQKLAYLLINYNHFIERNSHYLSFVAMILKCWCNHLKVAKEASVTLF